MTRRPRDCGTNDDVITATALTSAVESYLERYQATIIRSIQCLGARDQVSDLRL